MFRPQLTKANECRFCAHVGSCSADGLVQCTNPDPNMTIEPYGEGVMRSVYPVAFDPVWKSHRCENFSLKRPSEIAPPDGDTCRNSAAWRARGFKVVFRNSKVYLLHHITGQILVTSVNRGKWMEITDLSDPRWVDATRLIAGTHLETEFQLIPHVCYCDSCGVGCCDFCGGVRPIGEVLPFPAPHSAAA